MKTHESKARQLGLKYDLHSALVIDLGRERKRQNSAALAPPLVSRLPRTPSSGSANSTEGEVKNRAAITQQERLSQVYAGHLLRLLGMHPDIRAAIAALPPGTPPRLISERKLRRPPGHADAPPLVRLSWDRQLMALEWLLGAEKRPRHVRWTDNAWYLVEAVGGATPLRRINQGAASGSPTPVHTASTCKVPSAEDGLSAEHCQPFVPEKIGCSS